MGDGIVLGRTTIRCPKCRSGSLTASETTEASMLFSILDGVMRRIPHSDEFGGIVGVFMTCNACAHQWTPRRVHQVTQLLKD